MVAVTGAGLGWAVNAPQLEELGLNNIGWPAGSTLPAEWGNYTGTGAFGRLRVLDVSQLGNMAGPIPATWMTGFPQLRTLLVRNMPALRSSVTLSDWISMLHAPGRWSAVNVSDTRPGEYSLQLNNVGLSGVVPLAMFSNNMWVLSVQILPC